MPLVDPDAFADEPCTRIYIAGRLQEAKSVELTLTDNGIDYVVAVEKFSRRLLGLIEREYDGAAFYVVSAQAEDCRRLLRAARLTAGLLEE